MKVGELITQLSQLDPELTVVVHDADTGWVMNEVSVELGFAEDHTQQLCVIDGGGYTATDWGYLK